MPRPRPELWPRCGLCRVAIAPDEPRYRLEYQTRSQGGTHSGTRDGARGEKHLVLALCKKCGRKVRTVLARESAVVEAEEIIANGS